MYMAMSNTPENGGTTRLHLDITHAVNLMVWVRDKDRPGATWHVYAREHVTALRAALRARFDVPSDIDPIHIQAYFLTPDVIADIEANHGIAPWSIEQSVGELVFIPAGCPHQVMYVRIPWFVCTDL